MPWRQNIVLSSACSLHNVLKLVRVLKLEPAIRFIPTEPRLCVRVARSSGAIDYVCVVPMPLPTICRQCRWA